MTLFKMQLIILSNMESLNAYFMEKGASEQARYDALHKEAARQLQFLQDQQRYLGD